MPLLLVAAAVLPACGAGESSTSAPSRTADAEPLPSILDDPGYFVVFVDESGSLFLGDIPVQEEEMLSQARERLVQNPDVKALLFVRSSQIQGIHLTARLSEVGYKNVAVYYPTATPPDKKK